MFTTKKTSAISHHPSTVPGVLLTDARNEGRTGPSPVPTIESPGRAVRTRFASELAAVHSMMRHPRSLARPSATWRPPSALIPGFGDHPRMKVTLQRYLVGEAVRVRLLAEGVHRSPAYLVTLRLTTPTGVRIEPALAEAWAAAIAGPGSGDCVFELTDEPAPTFCWLVERSFLPIPAPDQLFDGHPYAA
ncbi:hypothetical protein JIM95_008590 [Corynebacterium sp. CCM 8835]|uniref:Uncharacterized protein n=1 Tax=Corynebacterium antarcticum TaxID=2800405 RepID=A0A9Q4CFE2_9CORY|nr:hypothetical protein [Corynebacterium antarcticum]MCK7642954.1 hypothetical protein [Corynebacterium antarcticum]MCK7661457.1 hypothetical protein [Corynebacterium antarcticum]MCL0246194.1 hypothetical protein [Corynebacterium antarcticum]MCX7492444.1 hypothetical protein [Corynebacterium antarcticum]MCX7538444.1 hypothetical protein [Corynebacterium antarcticum]